MHLHNHSQYSVIDGFGLIHDYLELAHDDGQAAFALTDHGTLGGIIDLYSEAKKIGVKPIAGIELYVDAFELGSSDNQQRSYGHLTILAKNEAGYRALIAANNLAHRQFYYRPRITLQQLIEGGFCTDWYILSGCMSSPINNHPFPDALNMVQALHRASSGVFLEAMWHPSNNQEFEDKQWQYLERIAALKNATGLPVVLTNDCHFAKWQNEGIHNRLLNRSHAPSDLEFDGDGFYFKTQAQMEEIASALGIPDAVDNAVRLSSMCELYIPEVEQLSWHVPDITEGRPEETLRALAEGKLRNYGPEYRERFEYEMGVLRTSPAILNSYLVAEDVCRWCRERDIIIAARGSMGGSLVSFLLGITMEDPIKYTLSFGRAVNPARPTIPDFDLDVSSLHRAEVLDYLKQRYAGNIAIAAYTHFGPKGAFRKILRMEGLQDAQRINELCRELPDDWTGDDFAYSGTQHKYVGVAEWTQNLPEQYHDEVQIYKGLYSTMSVHPSGLLVSGAERPIEHEVPFQWITSLKAPVSAFDMYTLKKIGLFKLDVLGLKTLDQLEFMERVTGATLPNDDYDDPEVLGAFGADLLAEIFQMDGYACRQVLKDIRGVNTFMDIVAANTLARPGAADFTKYYRSGFEGLVHEYPLISELLTETNGLILYQEQVMEIARILADFDDAEQDDVKESIKYFRHDNWENTIVPKFTARCHAKGIDPTNILAAIARMASYTYNKAHALTYAAIAYKMMWYKCKYPVVYYAATFDAAGDKPRLILESHFFGVHWHPPDVNSSEAFTVVRDGEIYLGLSSIKGVGPAAFEAIAENRPYQSLDDLMNRINRRKCNVRVIEAMRRAYALSSMGQDGEPAAFVEAYGFSMRYLDAQESQELYAWQREFHTERLGGFITEMRTFKVRAQGNNHGREMARLRIGNINGTKDAVVFPDVWRRAGALLHAGAAVKLEGEYQLSGEFIVHTGEVVE